MAIYVREKVVIKGGKKVSHPKWSPYQELNMQMRIDQKARGTYHTRHYKHNKVGFFSAFFGLRK